MRIKFYVINQDTQAYTCFVTNSNVQIGMKLIKKEANDVVLTYVVDPYFFYIFMNEIQISQIYRLSLAKCIKKLSPFVIKIIPPKNEFIDKNWGEIVRKLIWEEIEIDYMYSWFSTLGGAFSALGDYFEDRAVLAGKISIKQMMLANKLGDPGLLARSKLFLSISLIQQLKFKLARKIIEEQYYFGQYTGDKRLIKMCFGIWSKLQYSHKMFKNKRKVGT